GRAADVETLYPMAAQVMPELLVGVGTRVTAMGGAGAALADNLDSLYWNPAGLGRVNDAWVEFAHGSLIQDVSHEFVAFGMPVVRGHSLAAGINYFNLGAVDKTGMTPDGQIIPELGTFTPTLLGVNLGYGTLLSGGMTLGVGGKYLMETLGDVTQNTFALDLGCQLPFESGLVIAGALQNAGPKVNGYALPLEMRVGVGNPFRMSDTQKFTAALDVEVPLLAVGQTLVHLGAEYALADLLLMRAGFALSDANSLGSLSGLTAGLGLNLGSWRLGYAFAPMGTLGSTHRISLGLNTSTFFAAAPASAESKRRKKAQTPADPRMSFGAPGTGGGIELPKHPNRAPVLPSSAASTEDERMMRSLVQKGLSVKVEIQSAAMDSEPQNVEFTVQRGAGPKIAKWMLTITDMADKSIAALSGDGQPASIVWNGKNKAGKVVKNIPELSYDLVLVDVNNDQETANGMLVLPEGRPGAGRAAGRGTAALSPKAIVSGAYAQGEKLTKDKKIAVIYFEQGRAEITSEGSEKVGDAVERMKRYPSAKILLLGFCDPADEKANALLLSKNRAETIMRYLTAYYKVSVSRILVQAKGDKEPIVRSEDERLRNKNRRVEIVLQPSQ
ncbi:MAG: OmpA family protein, partial [Candidatus Firestonebacteria bacterium]|nr:OmpA family protein [Candidatus Firestonebacteria bacterium]